MLDCKYSHAAGCEQLYAIVELGGFQSCLPQSQRGRVFVLVGARFTLIFEMDSLLLWLNATFAVFFYAR